MPPRKRKVNLPPPVAEETQNENIHHQWLSEPSSRKVLEIVLEAQKNDSYHKKCVKQLKSVYEKMQHNLFMKVVVHCVQYALLLDEENEFGNTQLRFWAQALTSFDSKEDTHPIIVDIFNWLLDASSADSHSRFRLCFFVNALLSAMGPEAQLDDSICNDIQQYMIERMRDTNQNVRLQAVYALQRLQNPDDSEDRVIQCYIFHIDNDPSPKVNSLM